MTYIKGLLTMLHSEYSNVEYYTETDGEYSTVDCFVINDYCIKLDRIDVDTLSEDDLQIILENTLNQLVYLNY